MLVRIEKLMPAVRSAITLRKNMRGLLYSACLSTGSVLSWVFMVFSIATRSGQYTIDRTWTASSSNRLDSQYYLEVAATGRF